ncbi:MAG: beta-glucanase (GH16 family) [Flavobacteriales bacterium]|jgi:beta-glucanase (GH16 family)
MKHTNNNTLSVLKIASILLLGLCTQFAAAQTYYPPSNQLRGGEIQSKAEQTYGKVEVRMFSYDVTGSTSTFFWWKDGGHVCGDQWNEIDIELIPSKDKYQSNPIWQTSDGDCEIELWEELHGDANLYGRWVVYTLEWSPNHIAWYHDGQLDRWIVENDTKLAVNFIKHAMKYCFNLWTQGAANPAWLGNLDFDALQNKPVYQFVDYLKIYDWNGSSFNANPSTSIDFSSTDDLHNNFNVSNREFGQSMGYLSWSENAVGIVDVGNGNGALWLGLFHNGQERAPSGSELPTSGGTGNAVKIEAESALNVGNLEIAGDQLNYINDGAWASYAAVNIPSAGQYQVTYQVASAGVGGSIQLEQGGGATVYGNVTVPITGGWSNWTPVSHTVNLPAGNVNFGLYFASGGFNLESFSITPIN